MVALSVLLGGCGGQASSPADQAPAPVEIEASAPVAPDPTTEPGGELDSPTSMPAQTETPPQPAPPAPPAPAPAPAGSAVAVTDVIDGDTIDTTAGRVRVIGIDTPERGECNFGPASSLLKRLIAQSGNQVVLTAVPGKDDSDRYGRLLRYVDSPSGQDLGRELIAAGLAIARYDSRDGYGAHPREADYVALDAAVAQVPCPGASG